MLSYYFMMILPSQHSHSFHYILVVEEIAFVFILHRTEQFVNRIHSVNFILYSIYSLKLCTSISFIKGRLYLTRINSMHFSYLPQYHIINIFLPTLNVIMINDTATLMFHCHDV